MYANLVLCLSLFSGFASAETTATFAPSTKSGIPNLIEESRTVAIMNEASVQTEVDPSRSLFGFFVSSISAKKIDMFANEKLVSYKSLQNRPALGASWTYLPLNYFGYWGLTANVNYSYFENRGTKANTALHWVGGDLGLLYRHEINPNSFLKPFLGLTAGSQVMIQRGTSLYNTSEARGTGALTVGTALNLNRVLAINSPLLWEMQAQWKRVFASGDDRLDFNGNHIQLGMQLAL